MSVSIKNNLYELVEPSTASASDATLQVIGKIAVIRFDYFRDGTSYRSGIKFSGVAATRTHGERCCTVWHIEQCYDVLCEVENSVWAEETRSQVPDRYRDDFNARHFMIYLDSAGSFEILADSFEIAKEEVGTWESAMQSFLT